MQANQKSQQDEIENRLKEIQKEVNAWIQKCVDTTSDSLAVIVIREPKTLGQRFSSQKSASCTACFKFPHPEISVVGNISCKKTIWGEDLLVAVVAWQSSVIRFLIPSTCNFSLKTSVITLVYYEVLNA